MANATGYQVERRAEGSALIVNDRSFTDVPFPTNATVKQVALLLCDVLAKAGPGGELSREALRGTVTKLLAEHGAHWGRDHGDPEVLLACGLAAATGTGSLVPSPLAARYRSPTVRMAGAHR